MSKELQASLPRHLTEAPAAPVEQVQDQPDLVGALTADQQKPLEFKDSEPVVEQQESTETEQESIEASEPVKEESPGKVNWKELRQKADRADKAERERDEAIKILKSIEEEAIKYQQSQRQYQQPQQQQEQDFDYNSLSDDDLIEGKQLKKILSQESKKRKSIEDSMKQQQQYAKEMAVESRMKSRYNDLFEVISHQNIEALRKKSPEIARSINMNPDMEEKTVALYSAIKDLGIYQPDAYDQDRQTAQRNAVKPRPLSSVGGQQGSSPLSQANAFANGLTDDLKKKLYEEMKSKSRGY